MKEGRENVCARASATANPQPATSPTPSTPMLTLQIQNKDLQIEVAKLKQANRALDRQVRAIEAGKGGVEVDLKREKEQAEERVASLEREVAELQNQLSRQSRISFRKLSKQTVYLKDTEKEIESFFDKLNQILQPEKTVSFSKD